MQIYHLKTRLVQNFDGYCTKHVRHSDPHCVLFTRLDTGHSYTMDISQTNRVWDYVGDNFVHRLLQTDGADGKLVAAEGVNCKTNSGCTGGTCVHGEEKMKSLELVITFFLFHVN